MLVIQRLYQTPSYPLLAKNLASRVSCGLKPNGIVLSSSELMCKLCIHIRHVLWRQIRPVKVDHDLLASIAK